MLKGLTRFATRSHRTLRPRKPVPKQSYSSRRTAQTERYTPSSRTKEVRSERPLHKSNAAKWALAGAAVGLAAATLLFPGAGIMAAVLSTGAGAVSGAALSSDPGAVEMKYSKRESFDPYNPNHVSDPKCIFEPNNPLNPIFWDQ